jgi:hypothetical protein
VRASRRETMEEERSGRFLFWRRSNYVILLALVTPDRAENENDNSRLLEIVFEKLLIFSPKRKW